MEIGDDLDLGDEGAGPVGSHDVAEDGLEGEGLPGPLPENEVEDLTAPDLQGEVVHAEMREISKTKFVKMGRAVWAYF